MSKYFVGQPVVSNISGLFLGMPGIVEAVVISGGIKKYKVRLQNDKVYYFLEHCLMTSKENEEHNE